MHALNSKNKHDNPILQITNIVFKNEVYCEHFPPKKKTLFTIINEVNVSFHALKSLRVLSSLKFFSTTLILFADNKTTGFLLVVVLFRILTHRHNKGNAQ